MAHQQPAQPQLQRIPSRKLPTLYLSNLPHGVAPMQIEEAFHSLAHVETAGVELLKKGHAGHVKTCGLASVTFHDCANLDLDKIIAATDGQIIMGRPMIVRKDKFVEDNAAYVHTEPVAPAK